MIRVGKALILGAGNFGTCLAQQLARNGLGVILWDRCREVVAGINENRRNPLYQTTFELLPSISATENLSDINWNEITVVVICIPVQAIRQVLLQLPEGVLDSKTIACASKGIEVSSGKFPFGIIADCLGDQVADRTAVLSGPSFAIEVMQNFPTAVSCASRAPGSSKEIQKLFHSSHFRVYLNSNPIGLELAGAMKNVIAIASGASAGLGFQMNTLAALITRGLAEIIRIGAAMKIEASVFTGLGGIGDLMLTCTSEKSRNFTVGFKLGTGLSFEETMDSMESVAEGVSTSKAAMELVGKLGVDAPITTAVYQVLYESVPVKEVMDNLLNRDAKSEN